MNGTLCTGLAVADLLMVKNPSTCCKTIKIGTTPPKIKCDIPTMVLKLREIIFSHSKMKKIKPNIINIISTIISDKCNRAQSREVKQSE